MNRRTFIGNASLSAAALSVSGHLMANSMKDIAKKKKYFVGAHVWVYAASQPGYDVSPILSQIFSDMAYAGFDGVETMEQPLRSPVYTKQIKELIEKNKIKLLGSSFEIGRAHV